MKKKFLVFSTSLLFIATQLYKNIEYSEQKASLMVIPSDNLLKRLDCLEYKEFQGVQYPLRDYQKAFVENSDLKFILSGIKESFAERGYPLEDLEQTLKGIDFQNSSDNLENFNFDPRLQVLKSARPDIVLELTYEFRGVENEDDMTKRLIFNLEAIDSYTKKSIAAAAHPGLETLSNNLPQLMQEQVEQNMHRFQDQINLYFQDILENGREISLRIVSENNAISDFRRDRLCENIPMTSWIPKWLKTNTVNGYGKRTINSASELQYNSIRIPLNDSNGFPISASEWSLHLIDDIMKQCPDIFPIDYSSGLGEAFLVLSK